MHLPVDLAVIVDIAIGLALVLTGGQGCYHRLARA